MTRRRKRTSFNLSTSAQLASRLNRVDDDFLEQKLEQLADDWEESREGPKELLKYDRQSEIREDDTLTEAEQERRVLKWRRCIGTRERPSAMKTGKI